MLVHFSVIEKGSIDQPEQLQSFSRIFTLSLNSDVSQLFGESTVLRSVISRNEVILVAEKERKTEKHDEKVDFDKNMCVWSRGSVVYGLIKKRR